MRRAVLACLLLLTTAACGGSLEPVALTGSESCAYCRMSVSDVHTAAELVARGEEPRFFDDLGCLANWLKERSAPGDATVFVADHRTGQWVPAHTAIYMHAPNRSTPMGSAAIAHEDAASRDRDPSGRGGTSLTAQQLFNGRLPGVPNGQ